MNKAERIKSVIEQCELLGDGCGIIVPMFGKESIFLITKNPTPNTEHKFVTVDFGNKSQMVCVDDGELGLVLNAIWEGRI